MHNNTILTIIFVVMAFITGFFMKDIFSAFGNTKGTIAPLSCTVGTTTYKSGDGFTSEDGCNSCSCQNGEVMCTTIACNTTTIIDDTETQAPPIPQTCSYNGRAFAEGESFTATDGCNTCNCQNGIVGCTKKACFNMQ